MKRPFDVPARIRTAGNERRVLLADEEMGVIVIVDGVDGHEAGYSGDQVFLGRFACWRSSVGVAGW